MERLLQYWDDVDDFVGIVGLLGERLRRIALFVVVFALYAGLLGIGVYVALHDAPLAVAIVSNLAVLLLHRGTLPHADTALA